MRLKCFLLLSFGWVWSCSSGPSAVKSVEVAVQKKTTAVTSRPGAKPEPVYSTSFAVRLAELALVEHGIQRRGRQAQVSFMDGIYSILFVRPHSRPMDRDIEVEIDARNSRILNVTTR
jgi:hypothetical protein